MDARYLKTSELGKIAERNILPVDINTLTNIGISPITDTLLLLERAKIENKGNQDLRRFLNNIESFHDKGNIFISELTQDSLGIFFNDPLKVALCFDRASNPYDFVKEIALDANEYTFWDINVYNESL